MDNAPVLRATITAHRGFLVFELLVNTSIKGQVVTSVDDPTAQGQSVINTAKHLGVSPEALELLQAATPSSRSRGELAWFSTSDGDVFSWDGGQLAIKNPQACEIAEGFKIGEHVVIENAPAPGARDAIEYRL